MKKYEPISNIMTTDVITLTLNDNLNTAEKLFKKHHIRHIPVVEEDRVIGMLSLTDLLRLSFVDSFSDMESVDTAIYNMLSIGQVMANSLEKVPSDTPIKDAAALLASKEFHALPVVDNALLVGIITTTDLLNYLVDLY